MDDYVKGKNYYMYFDLFFRDLRYMYVFCIKLEKELLELGKS